MIRAARPDDIPQLVLLENQCFQQDRISARQFRYLLTKAHAHSLVFERESRLIGYVTILYSRATSTARIYSVAVDPLQQRQGIARQLIDRAEAASLEQGKTSIRVEIREDNTSSRRLFTSLGYKPFRHVLDYYEDHQSAVRMEKNLHPRRNGQEIRVPYYQQSLEFTCGPACLMMAMKALDPGQEFSKQRELRLWREATTIFMTSGFGGCGPQGLALAALRRGFMAEIFLNFPENFLIDSVRSEEKKQIMRLVEEDMTEQCVELGIPIHHQPVSMEMLRQYLAEGAIPLVLISSWAIYRQKFPHWLVVIDMDDRFVYAHDPLIESHKGETLADSLSMPIAHADFHRMARYGKKGQRAVVLIRPQANTSASR
ncbi:GNAT family N-acetyltransferase/peptidase C39 family protein [Desulfopila aestuarii]|uniref:Ribosomal protein S18 acetylase RimI n=1 Tax=Desulfopila aestuarii DSM 18488 TaxID=1121416 RepID=A0A1M7YFC7_9BACT|nr:GNAT family N-acetyltransferase/peptidase C39 family protein [Desulfopila aestuarii]SHO51345.1 Ribosomal protein S18 acetylase RimI [Desulfopila aestuarii DSM 18488]